MSSAVAASNPAQAQAGSASSSSQPGSNPAPMHATGPSAPTSNAPNGSTSHNGGSSAAGGSGDPHSTARLGTNTGGATTASPGKKRVPMADRDLYLLSLPSQDRATYYDSDSDYEDHLAAADLLFNKSTAGPVSLTSSITAFNPASMAGITSRSNRGHKLSASAPNIRRGRLGTYTHTDADSIPIGPASSAAASGSASGISSHKRRKLLGLNTSDTTTHDSHFALTPNFHLLPRARDGSDDEGGPAPAVLAPAPQSPLDLVLSSGMQHVLGPKNRTLNKLGMSATSLIEQEQPLIVALSSVCGALRGEGFEFRWEGDDRAREDRERERLREEEEEKTRRDKRRAEAEGRRRERKDRERRERDERKKVEDEKKRVEDEKQRVLQEEEDERERERERAEAVRVAGLAALRAAEEEKQLELERQQREKQKKEEEKERVESADDQTKVEGAAAHEATAADDAMDVDGKTSTATTTALHQNSAAAASTTAPSEDPSASTDNDAANPNLSLLGLGNLPPLPGVESQIDVNPEDAAAATTGADSTDSNAAGATVADASGPGETAEEGAEADGEEEEENENEDEDNEEVTRRRSGRVASRAAGAGGATTGGTVTGRSTSDDEMDVDDDARSTSPGGGEGSGSGTGTASRAETPPTKPAEEELPAYAQRMVDPEVYVRGLFVSNETVQLPSNAVAPNGQPLGGFDSLSPNEQEVLLHDCLTDLHRFLADSLEYRARLAEIRDGVLGVERRRKGMWKVARTVAIDWLEEEQQAAENEQ